MDTPLYEITGGRKRETKIEKKIRKISNEYYLKLNRLISKRKLNLYREYIKLSYRELFNKIFTILSNFIGDKEFKNTQEAELYRRKFLEGLYREGNLKPDQDIDPMVYRQIYDVLHREPVDYNLKVSKYPRYAMDYIARELGQMLGISYKEFFKLTLEELEIILEISDLKLKIEETMNEEMMREVEKLNNESSDDKLNPFEL